MDKVGDLLIRIKNGYMASRKEVNGQFSNLSMAICELLKKEGYITEYKHAERDIVITLKYTNREPALTNVLRVSKPGRRVYKGSQAVPRVYDGLGIAIISTPKGVMSGSQARKERVGGEVMAYVW